MVGPSTSMVSTVRGSTTPRDDGPVLGAHRGLSLVGLSWSGTTRCPPSSSSSAGHLVGKPDDASQQFLQTAERYG
jgi:hypothetical protein